MSLDVIVPSVVGFVLVLLLAWACILLRRIWRELRVIRINQTGDMPLFGPNDAPVRHRGR